MAANLSSHGFWQRIFAFIEAGFDMMARYPYDLSELHWNPDLCDPPTDDDGDAGDGMPRRPASPGSGRAIKVVPSPASQRYRAARPAHTPAGTSRRKQRV